MKHKKPAKLLRRIKRITKFIERKKADVFTPAAHTIISVPLGKPFPQITLADFESLLKTENKKREEERRVELTRMEEQRRMERAKDLRKLELLLGLPP